MKDAPTSKKIVGGGSRLQTGTGEKTIALIRGRMRLLVTHEWCSTRASTVDERFLGPGGVEYALRRRKH